MKLVCCIPLATVSLNLIIVTVALLISSCEKADVEAPAIPEKGEKAGETVSDALLSRILESHKETAENADEESDLALYFEATTKALRQGNLELFVKLRDEWKYGPRKSYSSLSGEVSVHLDKEYIKASFLALQQELSELDQLIETADSEITANNGTASMTSFLEKLAQKKVDAAKYDSLRSTLAEEYVNRISEFTEFLTDFDTYQKAVKTGKEYDIRSAISSLTNNYLCLKIFTWEELEALQPSPNFGFKLESTPPNSIGKISKIRAVFDSWKDSAPPAAMEFRGNLDERIAAYEKIAAEIAASAWDSAAEQLNTVAKKPNKDLSPYFDPMHQDATRRVAIEKLKSFTKLPIEDGESVADFVIRELKRKITAGEIESASEMLGILAAPLFAKERPDWFSDEYKALRAFSHGRKSAEAGDTPAALYYFRLALRGSTSKLLPEETISQEIRKLVEENPALLEKPFEEEQKNSYSPADALQREVFELKGKVKSLENQLLNMPVR